MLCYVSVLITQLCTAQEMRIVKGTLRDEQGFPMPGVTILEKGTAHGTITDINGFYSIEVPKGAILVYSYIGYASYEKKVRESNSDFAGHKAGPKDEEKVKYKSSYTPVEPNFSFFEPDDSAEVTGRAAFSATTGTYSVSHPNFQSNTIITEKINSVNFNDGSARISHFADTYLAIPNVTFSSSISSEQANRLPKLQNKYAQGRPENGSVNWRGPETGEIFSWGPLIQDMEYDGSEYDYDKNGRLVAAGSGNGKEANPYKPLQFFIAGSQYKNTLQIDSKTEKLNYLVSFSNLKRNGIIPGSQKSHNSVLGNIDAKLSNKLQLEGKLIFENSNANLMDGSPALSLLMASVFSCPVTFDNANGLSSKQAADKPEAYWLEYTGQRSYAANNVNNPYWLLNNLTDKSHYQNLSATASIDIKLLNTLNLNYEAGFQKQLAANQTVYPAEILSVDSIFNTSRNSGLVSLFNNATLKYAKSFYRISLNTLLNYEFRFTESELLRTDFRQTDNNSKELNNTFSRNCHTLSLPININFDDILLTRLSQVLMFSENDQNSKALYMPSAGAGIRIDRLLWFYEPFTKIRANYGYILSEVPLSFTMGEYSFQNIPAEQFANSYYFYELQPDFSLLPEKTWKQGIGLDFNHRGKIELTFDYYSNRTENGIFPILSGGQAGLNNIADLKSNGMEANLWFRHFHNQINYSFGLVFSTEKNKVEKLHTNEEIIPLSGYSDIFTALVENQPKGVLVGTTYQRNESGKLIIGTNGYPLVDPELHVLGKTNPDFILGFTNNLRYRRFTLELLLEYRKGGHIWNGTQNTLSYLGMSATINETREITDYIYDGVNENGERNNIVVDFANPEKTLESNRWVNYGPAGVAEDAIQDASSFRIRNVSINYSARLKQTNFEITCFAKNPFLLSEYKGVDPESILWGSPTAYGLDLFNNPSVKSFGVEFKIKL